MKIVRLAASNVKRLTAVNITPDGALITIGGKNGAGKSSVLDSIAYALGGAKLVPTEPIRKGESEASITVDLGDIVVERKFKRDQITLASELTDEEQAKKKLPERWTETRSTLVVRSKDGLIFPSPQAVLDKLLGKLTFDPLAFVTDKDKSRTLRTLVGLDTTEIDTERKTHYDQRALKKRELQNHEARIEIMPFYKDVGTELLSMDEVSAEMLRAEKQRDVVKDAQRGLETISGVMENRKRNIAVCDNNIERLEKELVEQKELRKKTQDSLDEQLVRWNTMAAELKKVEANLPDYEAIRTRIATIEDTNTKVRANLAKNEALKVLAELSSTVSEHTDAIEVLDLAKTKMLEDIEFPVKGLGFDERGEVTFDGVPFDQASRAEQLRVSVAIGLALNPKLKVLLIKEGSALDSANLKVVADQAAAADAQVWVERVAESKEGVSVMIEDGAQV